MSRAAADLFKKTSVYELVNKIIIDDEEYSHNPYTFRKFSKDYYLASASSFNEDIIRIIPIVKVTSGKVSIRRPMGKSEVLTVKNFEDYNSSNVCKTKPGRKRKILVQRTEKF